MRLTPIIAVLALSACTVGPNFTTPEPPKAQSFLPTGETSTTQPGAAAPTDDWWTLFHSDRLNQVVSAAVAHNFSLEAANARLAGAQEEVAATAGGLYPQVTATGGVTRQKVNLSSFGFAGPNPTLNLYSLGPQVSYALDVFGGTHRQVESLTARAEGRRLQLAAARLVLTGQVATDAAAIASAQAQLTALSDIVANDERNLDLVRRAEAAGRSTEVDVLSAKTQLAHDRTLLPPIQQQLSVAHHALAILTGELPGAWMPPPFELSESVLPDQLPVELPSALVHRRPDILAAEADLHAATAEIGVATAAMYPSISLSAAIAQGAPHTNLFFSSASTGWSFGAGLMMPIFEGGTLRAKKREAVDAANESLAIYRQTVLNAFGQVADSLTALDHDNLEMTEQTEALGAAKDSLSLVRQSYEAGESGILQVLDAEREYQQARLGLVRAQVQRLDDAIALLVATGSGWRPGS